MPVGNIASASELLQRYAAGEREFEEVRLSGADLQGAILHGIDLSEAILSDANLSRADLRGADLSWADLSGANLQGADLRGAILTRADLSLANLSRANLHKADLSLANLTGTDFSQTIMPDGQIHDATTPEAASPEETTPELTQLKLYHQPISANSRRVWIALLEKQIPFELITLNLDGDQFAAEFVEISPFNHIPVLVDDGFSVIESLAILDYLEAKYPVPTLLPKDAKALATVRMVELVTVHELLPAMNPLIRQMMGFAEVDAEKLEQSKQKIGKVLRFLETQLGECPYFGGDGFTLADIVAGTAVTWLPGLGVSLEEYPSLQRWCNALMQRQSWQQTQPTPEQIAEFKAQMRELMEKAEHS
ncbi:MAG: pentapeptide repeat-containing protein [Geitlerinemataceae cyanobacterium]